MIRLWLKRGAIAIAALLAITVVSLYVVVATEAGTRWMFARVESLLPAQLQIDGIGGSLLSGLTVNELKWSDESIEVTAAEIYTSIEFRPLLKRHVSIEMLRAQSIDVVTRPASSEATRKDQFAVELPLKISLAESQLRNLTITTGNRASRIDAITLAGEAEGSIVQLQGLSVSSDWLRLNGDIRVELVAPYQIDTEVVWALEQIIPETLSGTLAVEGDSSGYRVDHVLELPQEIRSSGTVRLAGSGLQYDFDNRWDALTWPLNDAENVTSSGGTLQLNGDLDGYRVESSTALELAPWPMADVQIAGQGNLAGFELSQLQATSEIGRAIATGTVDWSTAPYWEFDYSLSEIQIDQLHSETIGVIDAEGTVVGNIGDGEQLVLDVRANRITGTLNEQAVQGEVTARVRGGDIDLADSWLAVEQNRIGASGRLAPELDLALEWNVRNFSAFIAAAGGQSKGNATIRRSAAAWEVNADVEASDFSWQTYGADRISLKGDFSTIGKVVGTLDGANIRVNDQVIETLDASTSGSVEQQDVRVEMQAGDRTLQFAAAGAYIDQQWTGQINSLQFVDGEATSWANERPASFVFSSEAANLDLCLQEIQSTSEVCAEADYQPDVGQLNVTIEKVPLSLFADHSTAEEVDVAGFVGAELVLDWKDQKLNGRASMQLNEAVVRANFEGEEIAAAVERGVANATIVDNKLSADAELQLAERGFSRSELSINDITDPQSPLNSRTTVELTDLEFVPFLVPAVADVGGAVRGALDITGVLAEPELGGNLRLDDGTFRIASAGVTVTNVDVELVQTGTGQLSLEGSAKSGGGEVLVAGDSRIDPVLGLQTALTISGDSFEFIRLPEWRAIASPNLEIKVDNESATVRGSLNVPSAQVTLQSLPETAERVSPDAQVLGTDEETSSAVRRISLDVETTLGEDVALSGFGLETNLTGSLRLTGESGEPLIGIGRIDLRDGRYEAYGQQLDIENGALLFSGPLTNPTLDIRAVREVSDVTAGLQLSGTPNDLRSTVFSEPALSDAEALSYLIAGRPLEAADDEESNRVGQAAFALGLTGADKVIAQVQSKLGLDSLTLDSSDDVGRIVAGRRIGGRLLVEYGYGIVDRLGTLLLRYQLNDRVIVETTTGTASTLDVVYSVKKN